MCYNKDMSQPGYESYHHIPPQLGMEAQPETVFSDVPNISQCVRSATLMTIPLIAALCVTNEHVAKEVKAHDQKFAEDPWQRFKDTVGYAIDLVSSDPERSAPAMAHVHEVHEHVSGARDPKNRAFVLMCVQKGIDRTKPWGSRRDRETTWQSHREFAERFDISLSLMPENTAALDAYWNELIHSGELVKTDASKELVRKVTLMEEPWLPDKINPLSRLWRAITITTLDEPLREAAGLLPNDRDIVLARRFDKLMAHTYGRTPQALRGQAIPLARKAAPVALPAIRQVRGLTKSLRTA
jgi:uncharacterized protein (DUF2236 family)